ncbi:MAG TPA: efflux RND transporter permease subunit [Candidatus Methylacidiphilales bacterium]|nr:efflux RND transporter permease subunit [Candidatus Methylacidiphilales bacterium]
MDPLPPVAPSSKRRGSAFASLADLSIRRPVFAWMLMAALIIFGAIGLSRLGVSEQPDVDFPVLTINVSWSGASPEVMETEIVDRIEEQVLSIEGIRGVNSQIQQGQASITMEFEIDRNIDAALTEVQSKLSNVELPLGADSPTIVKSNPEDQPIVLLSASSTKRDLHALTEFLELNVVDQLKILPGVGEVSLAGYEQRNLRVWVDNNKLKPLQLTILDVKNALASEQVEEAAGYLENSQNEFNVRTMGEGVTPEAVGNIRIKKRGGEEIYNSNIRIKDVARVEDGLDDIRHVAVVNGHAGIGIGIKKQHGANSVAVAQAVKDRLAELKKTLPPDISIDVNFDSSIFIKDAIHETEFTLILSALITSVVCFLFLGSVSSTVNVLLSIPTSVMGTFAVLYFMGFTLNFFTLLGLSLAIGIVVDDAIMVLENIIRHSEMGKSRVLASRDGAREITFAALAATIAVVAIFLPVAFMSGIIGRFFFQFGITISAAVLLSLVEAITVTPMRCSQFMGSSRRGYAHWAAAQFDHVGRLYRGVLGFCLNHRWMVIFASTAIFALSLFLAEYLPKEFLPRQDQSSFLIRIQTPVRSSIGFTEGKLVAAEKILRQHPEIDHFFSAIGGFTSDTGAADGAVTDGQVNAALIYVTLKPKSQRTLGQFALMDQLRDELNKIPGVTAVPQDLASHDFVAGRGFPIELNLRGPDYGVLEQKSQEIIGAMNQTGLFRDIDTDFRRGMPEVQIFPDRELATASGVTVDAIAQTVQAAIGGTVQGKFTNKDRRYDVRLRLEGSQRVDPQDILNLDVRTDYNELIPISSVIKTQTVDTYQTIARTLRERSITIYANIAPGKSQAEALDRAEAIARNALPPGYRVFLGGGAQTFRETFASLFFALWLGIVVSYMVLASQFNSFIHPFAVLLALPFSISGALFALLLTGQSINLYSLIGIVLLMGIVKKNSILLVEFCNARRFIDGMAIRDAILSAGPIRLRPILMTSLATLAAAIPPALALGPGAESRVPMAITVIGGVIVSTFFTLLVVPCAYSLLAHLEGKSHPEADVYGGEKPAPALRPAPVAASFTSGA